MPTKKPKPRNKQDLTLIQLEALKKRERAANKRIKTLELRLLKLEIDVDLLNHPIVPFGVARIKINNPKNNPTAKGKRK